MTTRSYQDAIDHLNTLQTSAADLEAAKAARTCINSNPIPKMIEQDAIDHLNTLQTSAADLEAAKAARTRINPSLILKMIEFLERIDYTVQFICFPLSPSLIVTSSAKI